MSKISIIIPVYGAGRFIERCARSLFEQNFDDLEYIFVDDCSPDNSIQILNSIISEYPNRQNDVRIIRNEKNLGQAASRNKGVVMSRGEYVAFVDSDDWVDKDIYNVLYKNAIAENSDISCCGIERICEDKHVSYFNDNIREYKVFTTSEAIRELLNNVIITCSPCDKLFKRDIVVSQPMEEKMIFEDFDIMPRWIDKATSIVYTGKPLYYYRTNPISTMSIVTKKRLDEVRASERRLNFYNDKYPSLYNQVKIQHIQVCLNVLSCTRNASNCKLERMGLQKKTKRMVTFDLFCKISSIHKFKYVLSLFGLTIFDRFIKIFK